MPSSLYVSFKNNLLRLTGHITYSTPVRAGNNLRICMRQPDWHGYLSGKADSRIFLSFQSRDVKTRTLKGQQ